MVELEMPRYGILNGNVVLYCRHDAERDLVHKVEWLKSGLKIFQFVKGRKPPFRYFQLPGASISNRSENFIELSNLEFSASGIYSCEVSIETPIYTKASSNHEFIVIQSQKHDPKIIFGKPVYRVGEMLEANCSTAIARPPPHITWFINDEKIYETQTATFANVYSYGTTWWERKEHSVNQLSIEVSKLHLGKNGLLQLTCLSTIPAYVGPNEQYADFRNHTINMVMAWGYWNASTVRDWSRSPRKNQKSKYNKDPFYDQQQLPPQFYKNYFRNSDNGDDELYASAASDIIPTTVPPIVVPTAESVIVSNSKSNTSSTNSSTLAPLLFDSDFEYGPTLSRRPSLDFNLTHIKRALSTISSDGSRRCSHRDHCPHYNPRHQYLHHHHRHHHHHDRQQHRHINGSVSAGNTLTRNDSRRRTFTTTTTNFSETTSDVEYSFPFRRQIIKFQPDRIDYYHYSILQSGDSNCDHEPAYATVFPNVPPNPGMLCQGEDKSIYRRGARRWLKLYRVNGHIFQPKRFNRRAFCAFCEGRIWGLGRQGFKCNQCKLLVHKKCHKSVKIVCTNERIEPVTKDEQNGDMTRNTFISPRDLVNVIKDASDQQGFEFLPIENDMSALEPGTQRQYSLDDFELIRVVGRGSYAKVLMVELKKTQRIYAMKVIKKALVTDDEDIDWVQSEKHVFETASNHPFLVGLHSCFQTPSRLFFVIEFVRGGDLMFHMQRQRRLPEEHARFYSAEISMALNFLHDKGIIYRDLKLDNVLLDHEGHIKLTDYGMCKEGIRPGDTTSTFCGTPNYIAPEILRGDEYGFSIDWWALGVLLYEMLAGRSPFDVDKAAEYSDQQTEDFLFQVILNKVIRIPRTLSVKASSVLKSFLNKNPAERLGCRADTGFQDIMDHPFYKTIDWELLEQKQVPPPYTPRLDSERDLANFPPEFTDEVVQLTPDNPSDLEKIDQSEFEGFEYVNPLLMSLEDCV